MCFFADVSRRVVSFAKGAVALLLIILPPSSVLAQANALVGVWITRMPTATGVDAQGWLNFFPNGTFVRVTWTPRYGTAPAACQIANGRWSATPTEGRLNIRYTIDDYEPKQCLNVPGTAMRACEPPPADWHSEISVQAVFYGLNALRMYVEDGGQYDYARAPAMPPVPPECYTNGQ
jgi:hypothetical protein